MRKCCVHQQNGLRHLRPRPNLIDMPLILAIATGRGLTVSPATFCDSSGHCNHMASIQIMPGSTAVTSFGRVISVRGSLARVGLWRRAKWASRKYRATVGRFVSIRCANSTIVAMITEVSCENLPTSDVYIASASVDLLGEILGGPERPKFQRGVTNYPTIGDTVDLINNQELRTVYAPTRIGSDRCRHPAAGPVRHRLCRCRGNAVQAFRGARHHRRRQIERRLAASATRSSSRGRTCGFSCSTFTTNTAAASATARWFSIRVI